MFKLSKQNAKLLHLNPREEMHGEEQVLALDIKLQCDLPNSFLDTLSPGLRVALYVAGSQADIEPDHLSALRFPQLPSLSWEGKMAGATLVLGPNKAESMEFVADIAKVRLAPQDGGTVTVTFSAQILPEPKDVGTLSGWLGEKIKVTVTPALAPAEPPLE